MSKLSYLSALLLITSVSFAQTISGKINGTWEEGAKIEGLIGATILIQGDVIGTVTDIDGKFSLKYDINRYPTKKINLVIQYVEHEDKLVEVHLDNEDISIGEVELKRSTNIKRGRLLSVSEFSQLNNGENLDDKISFITRSSYLDKNAASKTALFEISYDNKILADISAEHTSSQFLEVMDDLSVEGDNFLVDPDSDEDIIKPEVIANLKRLTEKVKARVISMNNISCEHLNYLSNDDKDELAQIIKVLKVKSELVEVNLITQTTDYHAEVYGYEVVTSNDFLDDNLSIYFDGKGKVISDLTCHSLINN